eukprot:TRINITY_DN14693_c0_g1_i2.p1 TRINITY_DN14693_c0_g1~~TRINITY_DN14693_c0_g1_i2.p1  ORF type:complete len:308 (-),score=60.08 TRINITY_DN14693_c0_g1_i2:260-1150(-)
MDVHKSTIVNAVVPKYFLSVAFPNSRDLIQAVLLMKQFDSSLDIFVQKSDYSFRQALDILRKIAECVREFQLNWRTHGKLHAGNVFLRQAEGAIEVRIGYVGLLETLETKTIPSAKCLPGQFAVNDERIDLSTDVNGFGILIWQVLTRQPGGAVVQDRAEMRTDCTRLIDAYCSACGDSVFGSFPKSEALEVWNLWLTVIVLRIEDIWTVAQECSVVKDYMYFQTAICTKVNFDISISAEMELCGSQAATCTQGVGNLENLMDLALSNMVVEICILGYGSEEKGKVMDACIFTTAM